MSTKLKTPITITIEHVENAVELAIAVSALKTNHPLLATLHPNLPEVARAHEPFFIAKQINHQLSAQGIDWNTWIPEKPFTIAGHEPVFRKDGCTIGCQDIPADKIDEFVKRWNEAKTKTEYPKYFRWESVEGVYRAEFKDDVGFYRSRESGIWRKCTGNPLEHDATGGSWNEITREEAEKILGIKL